MNINWTPLFSKLGNNSSLVPIIVKDSIDSNGRTLMAYSQSAKESHEMAIHDARERFIEENTTGLVWLAGIPLLKKVFDKTITNKLYSFKQIKEAGTDALANANLKLFNSNEKTAKTPANTSNFKKLITKLFGSDTVQSAVKNRAVYQDEISKNKKLQALDKELLKILDNTGKFKKVITGKMLFATAIPLALLGYVLPKYNQKLTANICKENQSSKQLLNNKKQARQAFSGYYNNDPFYLLKNPVSSTNSLAFKGAGNKIVDIFNNNVTNMAILDGGIATGRIATSREKHEGIERTIKEVGVIFFIYKGGEVVANMFNKIGEKLKTPIALDSMLLEDKKFQESIVNAAKDSKAREAMLHFPAKGEEEIVNFVDKEIKSGGLKNPTLRAAEKLGFVELIEGIRHPVKFVETKKIKTLNEEIGKFVKAATESADPNKFIDKAVKTKRASILANIALCATATAYVVPKVQYWYRENFAKTKVNPGIKLQQSRYS